MYKYAGVHAGRFYDAQGHATAARRLYEVSVAAAKAERAAHAARMLTAPRCTVTAASGPGRGVWKTMACDPPQVPRWLILPEHGKLCVCLGPEVGRAGEIAPDGGEIEPDDNEMPHRYKACEASASSCTARTG